jgi:hypothetical protein
MAGLLKYFAQPFAGEFGGQQVYRGDDMQDIMSDWRQAGRGGLFGGLQKMGLQGQNMRTQGLNARLQGFRPWGGLLNHRGGRNGAF